MPNLLTLDCRDDKGNLRMVVEAPKGSVVKLKYDPQLEAFELQRFISSSGYPYDWGFIPGTLAADHRIPQAPAGRAPAGGQACGHSHCLPQHVAAGP